MTSQLGRLRQWAGEVMASKDNKMFVSDEFKELESEIDMRKEGLFKIQHASEAYHRSLSKKKQYELPDKNEKLLPLDALGLVMINHGEEFGKSSSFGVSLVKLGRAHCKVATLQEAYAVTFKDTFITSLQRLSDKIKEYEHLNKKLESRRSAYESAHCKAEKLKQSKKEKEKLPAEAEEELERAKQRFDETAEDIRAHMELIRNDDALHLGQLTAFLDLEVNFAQQYLEVLKDVRSEWNYGQTRSGTPKSLSRQSSRNTKSPTDANTSPDSSDEGSSPQSKSSRRFSFRGESGSGSKPPSRPTSRLSRKRTNSNATATNEKDADTPPQQYSRRRSVAGWASSAVESVTNRRKKDKENFATLDDDDTEGSSGHRGSEWVTSLKKSTSIGSMGRRSPFTSQNTSPHMTKHDPALGKRVVWAQLDYEAKSSNELSFKAGAKIVVINEVLDAWWIGEVDNRRGLFPTTHISEAVGPSSSPSPPPSRPAKPGSSGLMGQQSHRDLDAQSFDDGYGTSELDEERDLTSQPLEHSPYIEGLGDTHSIEGLTTDDETHSPTTYTPKQKTPIFSSISHSMSSLPPEPVLLSNAGFFGRNSSSQVSVASGTQTPVKKVPPPPPPRRVISNTPVTAPPLPERRANASGGPTSHTLLGPGTTSSSSISLASVSGSGSTSSGEGYDRSPFESMLDLSAPTQPQVRTDDADKTNPF